jgi:hypothetical protein
VVLTGTSGKNTVADNIARVTYMHAIAVGSGGEAAGDIDIRDNVSADIYDRIPATLNNSTSGIWTVPTGATAYITGWRVSAGASTVNHYVIFQLLATALYGTLTPGIFQLQDMITVQDSTIQTAFGAPIQIPGGADIKVRAVSDSTSANVRCTCAFTGWFEY